MRKDQYRLLELLDDEFHVKEANFHGRKSKNRENVLDESNPLTLYNHGCENHNLANENKRRGYTNAIENN